ncbi:hypothetical protein QEZ54_07215 [Catellatospora sp. KI3]|uniref:hypothetical protein n=1 Tax=Catellatospora sp. KI3 TaxID=3041620 RepID=UPI002482EF68|nr:hypothetical protein [Catellatospora sp. KI3]MDI1460750.1 hypothetical protein [Catellatospora sp. KI3]
MQIHGWKADRARTTIGLGVDVGEGTFDVTVRPHPGLPSKKYTCFVVRSYHAYG